MCSKDGDTIKVGGYNLDEEQLTCVKDNSKHVLVIAGAGSGKTTTIIGKIKYLIENGVNKDEILAISFTNASVVSLKDKIKDETNLDVDVYTFHKLALNILSDANLEYKLCRTDLLEYLLDEYFSVLIKEDIEFMYTFLKYQNLFTLKINLLKKYNNYIEKYDIKAFKNLIAKFIRLMKTNGYDVTKFIDFYNKKYRNRDYYFLKLVLKIYMLYQDELESSNEIDFDDMIIKATEVINAYGISNKYKYIIIDEYQDSSLIRFNLIKAMLDKLDANLFVVGDDFQSIYKFAGCNLNIMLDFNKDFKDAVIYKITNTYRNSQELIDIAGSFIMKNKNQICKKLKSFKQLENPIKIVRYKNYKEDFKKLIKKISVKNSILILGRNNKDIYKLLDKDYNIDSGFNIEYIPSKINLKYMTVHKSKGLEADVVILINLVDDIMGFPSKLEDDSILNLVSPKTDKYPFSEERRLFYVALTRTKSYIYLYTPIYNESIFVKEIKSIIRSKR